MRKTTAFVVVASSILLLALRAATPIPVMILDGESAGPYHDWRNVTRVLERMLDQAGLFEVTVVTAPAAGDDVARFDPHFDDYQAVVLNYDAPDERWPDRLKWPAAGASSRSTPPTTPFPAGPRTTR